MGLYNEIKEIAKVFQGADNIELYKELLDLASKALELQNENTKLHEENEELKKILDFKGKIVKHDEPYITIQGENEGIAYCANCWERNAKLIQINTVANGKFACPDCNTKGVIDREKYNRSKQTYIY